MTDSRDFEPGSLPDVNSAILDADTLDALFGDLAADAEIQEISVKGGRTEHASIAAGGLEEARRLLAAGAIVGVQIRYRHSGQDWCDTLLATPAGVRLVRICQTPATAPADPKGESE